MRKGKWLYTWPHCEVYIDFEDGYVRTTFPDGLFSVARPIPGHDYAATLADLGYATAHHLTIEHDMLHTLIAVSRRLPWSPTLWAVAHGVITPEGTRTLTGTPRSVAFVDECARAEEAAVFALARRLNAGDDSDPLVPIARRLLREAPVLGRT